MHVIYNGKSMSREDFLKNAKELKVEKFYYCGRGQAMSEREKNKMIFMTNQRREELENSNAIELNESAKILNHYEGYADNHGLVFGDGRLIENVCANEICITEHINRINQI